MLTDVMPYLVTVIGEQPEVLNVIGIKAQVKCCLQMNVVPIEIFIVLADIISRP